MSKVLYSTVRQEVAGVLLNTPKPVLYTTLLKPVLLKMLAAENASSENASAENAYYSAENALSDVLTFLRMLGTVHQLC